MSLDKPPLVLVETGNPDDLDDPATPRDRQTQVRASITGLTGQRARSIARYNADARKDFTVGQFRDAGLPFQLDVGEETRCA